jgi:murein DD-endopeptidase MepM/ murein hydrolase activator NlpD
VDFVPWANRKISFRAPNGDWIGYSKTEAPFQILVDGNAYREAITPEGIDIGKLLGNMSPRRGTDGHLYLTMKIMKSLSLEDGGVLPQESEVLIDVEDFYITKTLQPVDSNTFDQNAPAPQRSTRDQFNTTLRMDGVTAATRPTNPKAADDSHEDTVVQTKADPDDDEGSDDAHTFYTPGNALGMDTYGKPFPSRRIFSSPVCSCAGGSCGISSNFGTRERFRTKNGKYGSHFHKGLDINTAAHRSGTPVVAAADGYLKIPVRKGRKSPKCGDPVKPQDLYESGYGYTVRLTHGNGFETQYSHLKSIAPSIRWCARIKRGERLGSMGETGNATGPHLHFGIAIGRRMVDPRPYMLGSNGNGLMNGAFFSKKCSDQPEFPEVDAGMREALRGGQRRQADAVRPSSGARATR